MAFEANLASTDNLVTASLFTPRCVDLFAGAGGFSLGALQSGFDIVFAVENDKHAHSTYQQNILTRSTQPIALYCSDIMELDAEQMRVRHFGEATECDAVFGGPPCQGFSTHRLRGSGIDDPRNGLVDQYFRFVSALRPKVFLMENVPGMLWPRHKSFLELFYKKSEAAGYFLHDPLVLDARDFGVPQRRKRVFILGIRNDLPLDLMEWPPKPSHASPRSTMVSSRDLEPWISSQNCFRPAKRGDPCDIHMNHSAELKAVFERTPKNGGSREQSGRTLACHKNHSGHKDVYGRIDPLKPAPTMTTACINPSKGRFVHPELPHGITVRQAARIQTFPEDFCFSGGLVSAGRQIGNAVPVTLARKLAAVVHRFCLVSEKISADSAVSAVEQ